MYQWRLLLEEYRPQFVYIKGIHNTVADAVSRLEYDPSVNQTAESFHTTKVRNKQSHQRQCWMTVSKNCCKLDIDSDNQYSYTDKHDDWNLVFVHHKEWMRYTLLLLQIADAQGKDQELKVYFKKNAKMPQKGYKSSSYWGHQSAMQKQKNNHSIISKAQGSYLGPPLPPIPWALASWRDDKICDVLERYAYYHLEICQNLPILPSQ